MLHPDILRENVDGEAIEWAVSQITAQPQPRKLLLILSDGAPVDDTTLTHNGSAYLFRHIKQVIAAAEDRSDLILAAVGIGYRVDELYRKSRSVTDPADLPATLSQLVSDIFQQHEVPL